MKQCVFVMLVFLLVINSINSYYCSNASSKRECLELNEENSSDEEYKCCWKKLKPKSGLVADLTGLPSVISKFCSEVELADMDDAKEAGVPGYEYDVDCSSNYIFSASLILLLLLV